MQDNTQDKDFEYDISKDREFDPVKKQIGGKEAERVVWSTYSLNKAVEALKQGLPLKANPFIGKNTKLLKADLVYKRTEEEIDDYIKCMQDPVYFASKCYLKNPAGGFSPVELRDYQINYLKHLQTHPFSIMLSCRQSGKSTTTAIYCLWIILFNTDKMALILSKSGPAGRDLLAKIKDMYMCLPYFLKVGVYKWNQSEISFDNNSSISTEAFSPTAGLGKTINFLILDEFAWCPPNDVELFYNNIIPTITADSSANVCIMSTQNGFNLFYKLWKASIEGKNIYGHFKVDWNQVPEWNKVTKKWEKRTEAWHKKMVGILGSEEAFQYQYGTQFSASDKCLVSRECLSRLRDKSVLWDNRTDEFIKEFPNIYILHPEYLFWDPTFDFKLLRTGRFLITVDLAEGAGQDSTVFNIFYIPEKDKFIHIGRWSSNEIELEFASLEFWLLVGQLFNDDRTLWSLEWNTYGALFYTLLSNYNENDYNIDYNWRFNIVPEGIDMYNFVLYKKGPLDEQIANMGPNINSKYIPGVRMTSGNKSVACSLLKINFEKGNVTTTDMLAINELEGFEDKNGNGSYKASYGHDDIIMTFVQIPLVLQTPRYKDFIEEIAINNIQQSINNNWFNSNDELNQFNMFEQNNMYQMPTNIANITEFSEYDNFTW